MLATAQIEAHKWATGYCEWASAAGLTGSRLKAWDMAEPAIPNRLLASLTATEFAHIAPHLRPEPLHQGTVLYDPGETMTRVYFPHTGVISLVVSLASGQSVEAAMVGRDSLAGGAAILHSNHAINKAIVQIAGSASIIDADHVRKITDLDLRLRDRLVRHEQAILVQAQQTAACNACHPVEARLSRWLLRCRDLMASDDLALTQEFLSQMLGVQRSSVSITAAALQDAGLIKYRRGHIRILDVDGLQNRSCECYRAVKTHAERLIGEMPVQNP